MIGEMIKAVRRERHLTQDEFASRLGINRATLSKYESNTIEPSSSMIMLIAKELNIPVSFLFGEASGQSLSFDFQRKVLSTLQDRLAFQLSSYDSEDLYSVYGTYDVYEVFDDIFNPKVPVSLERVETVANEIGVTTEYLLGAVEDPDDTLDNIQDHKSLWQAIDAFSALNADGQSKAIERIRELTEIPRYQNKKTPQDPEDPETAESNIQK